MESALIVSRTGKRIDFFKDMLKAVSCRHIVTLSTCGEARRTLMERDFDLTIVDAPLTDESGEELSRYVAAKGISQVILVVRNEWFDEASAVCEEDGVLTVAKPLDEAVFWAALKLAVSAQNRLRRMHAENGKLKQRIEDIRIVNRAKCVLISHLGMNEKDAHRYIEKQAMDMRETRRRIAEGILKTYDE